MELKLTLPSQLCRLIIDFSQNEDKIFFKNVIVVSDSEIFVLVIKQEHQLCDDINKQMHFRDNLCHLNAPDFISRPNIVGIVLLGDKFYIVGAAAYQHGNTSSRTITEVKQR